MPRRRRAGGRASRAGRASPSRATSPTRSTHPGHQTGESAEPEGPQRDRPGVFQLDQQQAGDQVAGEPEEQVDTDPARNAGAGVVGEDGEHGKGTETVESGAMAERRCRSRDGQLPSPADTVRRCRGSVWNSAVPRSTSSTPALTLLRVVNPLQVRRYHSVRMALPTATLDGPERTRRAVAAAGGRSAAHRSEQAGGGRFRCS